jgi:predicted NUDIX family NTP pyrophosphohydrolase
MYQKREDEMEVFLVHPDGPLWKKKDQGAWTLPKGEYEENEEPLVAAQREFFEETGFIASGDFIELGFVRQKSGKVVIAWAFEGDCDPTQLVSNTCEIEWPPKSKKRLEIPEVDVGIYFMSHENGKAAIELFDIEAHKVSHVLSLEKSPPYWIGAMPVSPDGKWMLFPQVDGHSSNLMMVANMQSIPNYAARRPPNTLRPDDRQPVVIDWW